MINIVILNDCGHGSFSEYHDRVNNTRVIFDNINSLEECYRYGGMQIQGVMWVDEPDDPRCKQYFQSRIRKPRNG